MVKAGAREVKRGNLVSRFRFLLYCGEEGIWLAPDQKFLELDCLGQQVRRSAHLMHRREALIIVSHFIKYQR